MNPELRPADLEPYLATPSVPALLLPVLFAGNAALTILDVGACEGEDSIRYARLFPAARIFAFEPLPANQALIRENFRRHGVDRAELVGRALSDRRGEAILHVSSGQPPERFSGENWNYGNKSNSLLPPLAAQPMHGWIEFKQQVAVPTGTLDEFCAERGLTRIDFIHLDVQGAECLVLDGACRMLPRTLAIWLEVTDRALYRGQPLRPAIERRLRDHGFRLVRQVLGDVEGDQFYVNPRYPRTWPLLASQRLRDALGALRFRAGAIKSRLLHPRKKP
ncbi:MAG: FkbM family methyltransferase [Opitutaceae bacterium]|nr:FkbM family methyltransferase [Opitutaceae bacterium]